MWPALSFTQKPKATTNTNRGRKVQRRNVREGAQVKCTVKSRLVQFETTRGMREATRSLPPVLLFQISLALVRWTGW